MNTKEKLRTNPALKVIRIIVGCIIALLAGLLAGACAFCAFVVLFSALKPNAPGEQSGFFLLCFVLFAILFYAMVWGRGIKNGSSGRKSPRTVVPAAPITKLPPASEDQKRLEEIDQNIDYAAGAIQANPMSPVRGADEELLKKLQQEKQIRLRRMAKHMENVTVQDAWKTFTPEQQKRFDAQVYQYSQDVGRDGVLPREVYAKNRGLVFVDGRPIPKEVAARLKELQEAAAAEKEEEKMKKTLTFKSALRSDLKGYRMDMHTDSGEKFRFILSGLVAFNPNRSRRCGEGTDSWLFRCVLGNEEYILNFDDDAGYGTCWSCALISPEDAGQLKELEAADWLKLMARSAKRIHHLHPDHAAKARVDMKITSSRCGPIDAEKFYGR